MIVLTFEARNYKATREKAVIRMRTLRAEDKRNGHIPVGIDDNDDSLTHLAEAGFSKEELTLQKARLRMRKTRAAAKAAPDIPTINTPLQSSSLRTYLTRQRVCPKTLEPPITIQPCRPPGDAMLMPPKHQFYRWRSATLRVFWCYVSSDEIFNYYVNHNHAYDEADIFAHYEDTGSFIVNDISIGGELSNWEEEGMLYGPVFHEAHLQEGHLVSDHTAGSSEVSVPLNSENGDPEWQLPEYIHVWPEDTSWKDWWTVQGFYK